MTAMQNTMEMYNLFSFFSKDSKQAETKRQVSTLTELIDTQQLYEKAHKPLAEATFVAIKEQIAAAIKEINPSGSNDRLPEMDAAIRRILSEHAVPPVQYWGEVWRRSGKRDLSDYNR